MDRIGVAVLFLVDDDTSVLEALDELVHSIGLETITFTSMRDFLGADLLDRPGCIIADVRMPGRSGLDLQSRLRENGNLKPIIFLTGYGDIAMSVHAMKAGAVDFLTKPVRDQTFLDTIAEAIDRDRKLRAERQVVTEHLRKLALLTTRERQVLREVALGG